MKQARSRVGSVRMPNMCAVSTRNGAGRATLVLTAMMGMLACGQSAPECECDPPGFTVTVPPESASLVNQVVPSGPACTMATVSCAKSSPSGGCASYLVLPSASGNCQIDLYFAGGTDDEQNVNIVHTSGCCSGFHADPPSAGDVVFPSPATDAGAGGSDV